MDLNIISSEHIITFVVVNSDLGSKVLQEAKKLGVTGGTIFLGKGTVRNRILEILGLDEIKKEIVIMVSKKQLEDKLHSELTKKFHMEKPNHGIIFSIPINRIFGVRNLCTNESDLKTGGNNMMYEAIFTIVDRGIGQEVVDVAKKAGARGATIINARGSGIHENDMFFSLPIEPEKEIVMMIVKKEKSDEIIKTINDAMKIDEPGKGIMFVMDVNKVSGLFREEDTK